MTKTVYYSGSIKGDLKHAADFGWHLVQYIKELGFEVLSEHVAARNEEERAKIFFQKTGVDITDPKMTEPWLVKYKVDMEWVDRADYMVAVVDGPSHGVGMEIMRALLRKDRGLPPVQILCLAQKNNLEKLSNMIRGVPKTNYPEFKLVTYNDLEDAKNIVKEFMVDKYNL